MLFVILISNRCPPYIKSKGPCSLHSLAFGSQIHLNIKKICPKKIYSQGPHKILKTIYNKKQNERIMRINFDDYEKDLLIDTIQHRLDTDKLLIINHSLREEIEDLLRKIEEDEYV